jgi:ATP-dependent exoDNAse (exonuclease V) alpha subunit
MGVPDSHNISMFLADPQLRDIPAESIVIADEASMVTMPHLDAITRISRQNDAKMMLAGDPAQHQAVTAAAAWA